MVPRDKGQNIKGRTTKCCIIVPPEPDGGQIQADPLWFLGSVFNESSTVSLLFPRPYQLYSELMRFFTIHARKKGGNIPTIEYK